MISPHVSEKVVIWACLHVANVVGEQQGVLSNLGGYLVRREGLHGHFGLQAWREILARSKLKTEDIYTKRLDTT